METMNDAWFRFISCIIEFTSLLFYYPIRIHQIEQLKTQRQLCYEFVRVCWAVTTVIMLYIINGILYILTDCKLGISLSFCVYIYWECSSFCMMRIELNAFHQKTRKHSDYYNDGPLELWDNLNDIQVEKNT